VNPRISPRHLHVTGRKAGKVILALWLLTFALSISPTLHRLLHSDSQDPKHVCLITTFNHGQVLSSGSTSVVLSPESIRFVSPPPVILPLVSQPENRLLPGRAPPMPVSLQQG
jgi:hypothetical protein